MAVESVGVGDHVLGGDAMTPEREDAIRGLLSLPLPEPVSAHAFAARDLLAEVDRLRVELERSERMRLAVLLRERDQPAVVAIEVRAAVAKRIDAAVAESGDEWPRCRCIDCDGLGTVADDEDCDTCDGDGHRRMTGAELASDVDLVAIIERVRRAVTS